MYGSPLGTVWDLTGSSLGGGKPSPNFRKLHEIEVPNLGDRVRVFFGRWYYGEVIHSDVDECRIHLQMNNYTYREARVRTSDVEVRSY